MPPTRATTLRLSRSFTTRVEPTQNVLACASAFGIGVDEEQTISLYQDLDVRLGRSRILYVTGDSGAGKSCLLRDIAENLATVDGYEVVRWDEAYDKTIPVIDQFDGMDIKEVSAMLAYVGIAEPFVYLRRPQELSDGQRYRFMLAKLIHAANRLPNGVQPVILVDEFLALLDRETARNVAYQVRRVSSKFGHCFVVATTHADIADDLRANTTITLRLNIAPKISRRPLAGV
jgi:ABC-type ATPase with predicted acetyltransferase domain